MCKDFARSGNSPQKSCESISDVMGSLNVDEEAEKLWKHFKIPNQPKRKPQELLKMDKHSLFMELLRDVVAPNFDVNTLSHKILVNVMLLVNADRSSLFLADEGQKMLVSRLFDVTIESSVEDAIHEESEAIKIPFGKGLLAMWLQPEKPLIFPMLTKCVASTFSCCNIMGYVHVHFY